MSKPVKPVIPMPLADEDERPVSLNPEGWLKPVGYANGMSAKGRIVVTGGVVGWDLMGKFPEDFAGQALQCFTNIKAIVEAGGASVSHIVRLTWYVTDVEEYLANLKPLGKAYRAIFGQHYPAMAVVQVVRLVEKAAKIEIEATAVVAE